MPTTGFIYDDIFLKHDTGQGHPERAERLTAILDRLGSTGLLDELARIKAEPASRKWICSVHDPEYVARVKESCARGASYVDTMDCPVSADTYDAAVMAAGGVMKAVDSVMSGDVRNAFCAVRPPGHHALADTAMGFCFFNNVAIATRYLQKHHDLSRVLIVDWDVHHGNGTQATFYDDPNVMYFSSHRYPFYPGSGITAEQGSGAGKSTTVNAPLPVGASDKDILDALRSKLIPRLRDFRPEFILISAGFDAHEEDPLGGMVVTAEGFAELTRMLKNAADEFCEGRLVSMLEGGYDLNGLADCVEAHVRMLMNDE